MFHDMDFMDFSFAVFAGNLLTLCFAVSMAQFIKKDGDTSWPAYVGVILPILLLMSTMWSNGFVPPQFDALAGQ